MDCRKAGVPPPNGSTILREYSVVKSFLPGSPRLSERAMSGWRGARFSRRFAGMDPNRFTDTCGGCFRTGRLLVRRIIRSGTYFRVFKPDWNDPLDTSFSKETGGRWNAPGKFGVLSLCASLAVAAANARKQHSARAIRLFDLRPERRPSLLQVNVPNGSVLDVVSEIGVREARLPADYPWNVANERCQPIGFRAYRSGRLRGIASRCAAECAPRQWLGEELSWFDCAPALKESGPRRTFARWYPDVIP